MASLYGFAWMGRQNSFAKDAILCMVCQRYASMYVSRRAARQDSSNSKVKVLGLFTRMYTREGDISKKVHMHENMYVT